MSTAPSSTAPASDPAPDPASASGSSSFTRFYADDDFDYAARSAIGKAAQGTIDIGLVLRTFARIPNGDANAWFSEWSAVGADLHAQAQSAAGSDRQMTAARLFLAASDSYSRALEFIDGLPTDQELLPTFRLHRACWEAFVEASAGCHLPVAVPYEESDLPGYLFRPDASGSARPTVVVTNGSDGALSGLWAEAISGALARGWNVFVFDGPGQQSMLFERGIPFRHDWEAVLTPVVDTLIARADVDETSLLGFGISQGGYWLPRALAFEHRFVAAVVDGGVVDVSRSWNSNLPQVMLDLLHSGNAALFNQYMDAGPSDPAIARTLAFRSRPYGQTDAFSLFTEVGRYTLAGIFDQITTPLLITDAEGDQFFPGQSAELFSALKGEKKLTAFTAAQGADQHCEPLARGLVGEVVGDFFAEHLAR